VITIGGERYVLVRAMSLSVHFFEFMKEIYPGLTEGEALEGAGSALFDIAYAIGRSDARAFCAKLGVEDPIAKLSSGPIHFACTGWAFVDISPESNASPTTTTFSFTTIRSPLRPIRGWLGARSPPSVPAT